MKPSERVAMFEAIHGLVCTMHVLPNTTWRVLAALHQNKGLDPPETLTDDEVLKLHAAICEAIGAPKRKPNVS